MKKVFLFGIIIFSLMFLLSCTKGEQSTEGITKSKEPQVDGVTNTVASTIDYRIYTYNDQGAKIMENEQSAAYKDRFVEQFDNSCRSFFKEVLSADIDYINNIELSFFEYKSIILIWVECDAEGEGVPQIISMQFDFESYMPLHVEIACTDAKSYVSDEVGLKDLAQKYADYLGIPVGNTSYTFQNIASQRCVLCGDTQYDIGISVSVEYGKGTDDVITLAATKRSMDLSSSVVLPGISDICIDAVYPEQKSRVIIDEQEAAYTVLKEIRSLITCSALPQQIKSDTFDVHISGLYNVELCTTNTIDQAYLSELYNESILITCLLDANTGKILYVTVHSDDNSIDFNKAAQSYSASVGLKLGSNTIEVNGSDYHAIVYQSDVSVIAGVDANGDFVLRCTTMPVKYN